ncbi:MAG: ABC transporter ATP-binding protein [Bacteroidales bacterium]|jgi:iron complex transport system ATP-binding protein|nr:ABC transporter ATP-binding protein [Bacteroidales bacterium]
MKISVYNTCFGYSGANVLHDVCFTVNDNDFVSILGPNGSGKSTLIKCMNGILNVQQGEILLGDQNIKSFDRRHLARTVAYVPQHTNHKNTSTVYEILELGRCPYINWRLKSADRDAIDRVIEDFHLHQFVDKPFARLSGGEQQKIKIARALVQEPQVLLLDEPTNNLDLKHQVEVLSLLSGIVKSRGITAIMAIHDLTLAARYSLSVLLLSNGRIVDSGSPADVIHERNVKTVYGIDVEIVKHNGSILIAL